jgi:hypothetical protein
MKKLNEIIMQLVEEHGLYALVQAACVTCARKAQFEADSGEMGSEARSDAWGADQMTLEKVLPMLVNSKM